MPDIDAVFLSDAREFYESQPVRAQADLDAIVLEICRDPAINGTTKFLFEQEPFYSARLYNDGTWWCVYKPINNWTLEIWNFGRLY